MAFIGIFLQIKLVFGPLVIQLVWYILKQIIHLSVGESGGYLPAGYLPARQISTTIHLHFAELFIVKHCFHRMLPCQGKKQTNI